MKTWEEMTKRERRVAIAKDVLDHLDYLNIKDGNGFIVDSGTESLIDRSGPITHQDCQIIRDTCAMCARGALMISRVDLFNSIDWSQMYSEPCGEEVDFAHRDLTDEVLIGAFGKKQLGKIEAAFEVGACYAENVGCSDATAQLCKEFGLKYRDAKDRLRAIMLNIVENGKFKP